MLDWGTLVEPILEKSIFVFLEDLFFIFFFEETFGTTYLSHLKGKLHPQLHSVSVNGSQSEKGNGNGKANIIGLLTVMVILQLLNCIFRKGKDKDKDKDKGKGKGKK